MYIHGKVKPRACEKHIHSVIICEKYTILYLKFVAHCKRNCYTENCFSLALKITEKKISLLFNWFSFRFALSMQLQIMFTCHFMCYSYFLVRICIYSSALDCACKPHRKYKEKTSVPVKKQVLTFESHTTTRNRNK